MNSLLAAILDKKNQCTWKSSCRVMPKSAYLGNLFPCALFKSFYFTDNNTDLDVNVNERTKGEQHSDM